MKNDLRKKIMGITGESYKAELAEMPKKWDYESQIAECSILPEMAKLSSDEALKGVKVYVELDAVFLNIRMENVEGYIFHERHNHPDDAVAQSDALKKYFEESGYIAEKSDYGFYVILKP